MERSKFAGPQRFHLSEFVQRYLVARMDARTVVDDVEQWMSRQ